MLSLAFPMVGFLVQILARLFLVVTFISLFCMLGHKLFFHKSSSPLKQTTQSFK